MIPVDSGIRKDATLAQKEKALREDLKIITAELKKKSTDADQKYKQDVMKALNAIKKAKKAEEVATEMDRLKVDTVKDLYVKINEQLESSLVDTRAEKKVVEQVKEVTDTTADIDLKKPKYRFVRNFMNSLSTKKGTVGKAKQDFRERIKKLSNKAVMKLLEEGNLQALVEGHIDTEGKERILKSFFKKELEKRIKRTQESKKFFKSGTITLAASGNTKEQIATAITLVQAALEAGDFEAYQQSMLEVLDAVTNASLGVKLELVKVDPESGVSVFDTFRETLEPELLSAEDSTRINERLTKIQKDAKKQVTDVKKLKREVLSITRAKYAIKEDIEFARNSIEKLDKSNEITSKQATLLKDLLEDLTERSADYQIAIAEDAKAQQDILDKQIDDSVSSNKALTQTQKAYLHNVRADWKAQLSTPAEVAEMKTILTAELQVEGKDLDAMFEPACD